MRLTKTKNKWLYATGFSGVFFLSLFALTTVFHPFASAAFLGDRGLEYGYFYNQWAGGRGWHQVIPGGIPDTADKGTFINYIIDRYYNGTQQQRTGAAFIINLQLGRSGSGSNRGLTAAEINDWSARIQQPQVSFSMENYSFTYNSAYDTPTDDDLFYADPDTRYSLVIRYNGVIVSVVKQDCANPLDGNSGIPQYAPSWNLSVNTGVNTPSVFPGQSLTFNYNIRNNGPDPANFWYSTKVQEYIGAVAQPVAAWPVPDAYEGGLPAGATEPNYSTRGYPVGFNTQVTRVCAWVEYAGPSSSNGAWTSSNTVCATINQPTPSCASFSTNPTVVEPGTAFTATASVTYQNAQAAFWTYQSGGRLFSTITGPGGYNVDKSHPGVPPSASDISYSGFAFPAPPTSGLYTVTYGIRGGTIGNITCTAPLVPQLAVGYHPYFRVDAGDVSAGAGFTKSDGTCTASTAAQIRGSNKGASGSPAFLGAGAQLGAMALGTISGFPTSTNDGGGSSGVGAGTGGGLTFANTPSLGGFGALPCMSDYASKALAEAASVTPLASGNVNLSSMSSGTYQVSSGNITLDGNLSQNTRITIVVMGGDAIITGDIKYGGYPDMSRAPQFRLIVANGGNIRIKNNVSELHGAFIALPNTTVSPATGGTLSTCYDTGAGTDTVDYNTCKNKLTIYGAVVANTLLLERTFGSLKANAVEGVVVQPAETINNTPELWAAPGGSMNSTGIQVYDSVVSLPPVL